MAGVVGYTPLEEGELELSHEMGRTLETLRSDAQSYLKSRLKIDLCVSISHNMYILGTETGSTGVGRIIALKGKKEIYIQANRC